MVALTNAGSRPCAVSGYPSVVLLSGQESDSDSPTAMRTSTFSPPRRLAA